MDRGGTDTLVLFGDDRRLTTPLPDALSDRALEAAREGGVALSVQLPPAPKAPLPIDTGAGGLDIGGFLQEWGHLLLLGALVIVAAMAVKQVGGARFKDQVRQTTSTTRFDEVAGIDEIRDEVAEIADVLRDPVRYERVGADPAAGGDPARAPRHRQDAAGAGGGRRGRRALLLRLGLGVRRGLLRPGLAAGAGAVCGRPQGRAGGGLHRRDRRRGGRPHRPCLQRRARADPGPDPGRAGRLCHRPHPAGGGACLHQPAGRARSGAGALGPLRPQDRGGAARPRGARAILDVHTRRRPLTPGTELGEVAAFTAGMAGADLAALCNEASFEAARAGRQTIGLVDFRRALIRLAAGPERRHRVLRRGAALVAYHEIGHALVGHLSPSCDPVERVTVIPQGQALGVTISLPSEDRFLVTRQDCLERLAMMLAGRAAEELFFSEQTSGAADDLARAATLARRMVGEFGMGQPTTPQSLAAGPPDGGVGAEREEREAPGAAGGRPTSGAGAAGRQPGAGAHRRRAAAGGRGARPRRGAGDIWGVAGEPADRPPGRLTETGPDRAPLISTPAEASIVSRAMAGRRPITRRARCALAGLTALGVTLLTTAGAAGAVPGWQPAMRLDVEGAETGAAAGGARPRRERDPAVDRGARRGRRRAHPADRAPRRRPVERPDHARQHRHDAEPAGRARRRLPGAAVGIGANGAALAAWARRVGGVRSIRSSVRAPDGAWAPAEAGPELSVGGFAMTSGGDAMILSGRSTVFRPASGGWGPVEVIPGATGALVGKSALSPSGGAVAAWSIKPRRSATACAARGLSPVSMTRRSTIVPSQLRIGSCQAALLPGRIG